MTTAVEDFVKDISFYDANDLRRTLSQYMDLYARKVSQAESDAAVRAAEKEKAREETKQYFLYTFGASLLIGIILLLFSIQSLLKQHTVKS